MYHDPAFGSWGKVAAALRIPRGSAHSLAHGRMKAGPRTLQMLEAAEFRPLLAQAVRNLQGMAANGPAAPITFSRSQAARLVKQRRGRL